MISNSSHFLGAWYNRNSLQACRWNASLTHKKTSKIRKKPDPLEGWKTIHTGDILFLSMVAEVSAAEPTGITTTEINSFVIAKPTSQWWKQSPEKCAEGSIYKNCNILAPNISNSKINRLTQTWYMVLYLKWLFTVLLSFNVILMCTKLLSLAICYHHWCVHTWAEL